MYAYFETKDLNITLAMKCQKTQKNLVYWLLSPMHLAIPSNILSSFLLLPYSLYFKHCFLFRRSSS